MERWIAVGLCDAQQSERLFLWAKNRNCRLFESFPVSYSPFHRFALRTRTVNQSYAIQDPRRESTRRANWQWNHVG